MEKKFSQVCVKESSLDYQNLIKREQDFGEKSDVRSPFERDYTRIIHSTAYRRLKHKTQVFYNVESDHVCTRMEHVLHVESVSYTIAKNLGLNEELTRAIATGHDLGHAPFGHYGEKIISDLYKTYVDSSFWHERNGLYFADDIELLPDENNACKNLNLTYAVRDGIISHCGEQDLNVLMPRSEFIDLKNFDRKGKFSPITFEGCVVKISDKIAYVGRDIEDALTLKFLKEENLKELANLLGVDGAVNTTNIMSNLIQDVIENSSPNKGIAMSEKASEMLNKIKAFNYKYVYDNKKFEPFKNYAKLIITELFNLFAELYDGENTLENIKSKINVYGDNVNGFYDYVIKYAKDVESKYVFNKKIYDLTDKKSFYSAVLDYISGMTDKFAVSSFTKLITY